MRARLTFVALGVLSAVILTIWGLTSSGSTGASSASTTNTSARSTGTPSSKPSARAAKHKRSLQPPFVSNMHLVLDATFTGSNLNRALWDTCYPWIAKPRLGCTNFSSVIETDWDLPSQVHVGAGMLSLTAQKTPTTGQDQHGAPKSYSCRSGMVTSQPGFNFKFGYVEVQAHVPSGPGLWSALWLAASNLRWPPEIDILESFGAPKSESAMFFHPVGAHYVGSRIPPSYGATTGWHDFGMYWTSSEVSWYYDGARMMTVTQRIPQQDMYILLNLATYSLDSSRNCSGTLEIRSVKVWQH